jgi:F0F1-type ATP synthase membrane subunit c/vacuolar-type H+-ATPase subunit K
MADKQLKKWIIIFAVFEALVLIPLVIYVAFYKRY